MQVVQAAALRGLRAFKDAFNARAVLAGCLGSVLLVLGSLTPAYLPRTSPLTRAMASYGLAGVEWTWIGTAITMAGLALMLEFWLRVRPARRESRGQPQLRHWAMLAIVAAPMLIAPPIFSHDAYSYAAQGWLLHNDLNPYLVGPGILPGQFADQVAWVWRDTAAPYGPLALRMNHWLIVLVGFDPYWSAVIMRLPALIGVGMIGWCVPRIAGRFGINPAAASWFVLVNPIVIIDFVGGAHNDALMMGLAMMGIWVTTKWRTWWWGAVAVGLGATIKQPAVFVAVALPFITHPWTSWKLRPLAVAAARALASLAVSVAVFALLSVVTGLGFGWVNAVDVPGKVTSASPFNLLGEAVEYLLNQAGIDQGGKAAVGAMRSLGLLVCAIGIVWLALRHLGRRPLNFTGWGLLLSAFTLPALHSWYLLWGGVLFPMTRPSTRRLRIAIIISAVLLAYEAMVFAVRNGTWLVALLLIWAGWESVKAHELTQRWDAKASQESLVGS